jgi:hypothetical protein
MNFARRSDPAVRSRSWQRLLAWLLAGWLLAGCAAVRLVPDYDAEAAKGITDTAAEVFAVYDRMIELRAANPRLPYAEMRDDWGRVETRIRVMALREQARPLNSDSTAVATTILGFWQKYRDAHARRDDYGLRLMVIHRDRFQRLFTAALKAEQAKKLAAPDTDPAAETEGANP